MVFETPSPRPSQTNPGSPAAHLDGRTITSTVVPTFVNHESHESSLEESTLIDHPTNPRIELMAKTSLQLPAVISPTMPEEGGQNDIRVSATAANHDPLSTSTNSLQLPCEPSLRWKTPGSTGDTPGLISTPTSTQGSQHQDQGLRDPMDLVAQSLEALNPVEDTASNATEIASTSNRICYRLVCTDQENTKKQVTRYSWKPFEGLQNGDDEDKARRELAVMDVMDQIKGQPLCSRNNQLRHNFGTEEDKDPDPFVVGVDYLSRTTYFTMVRIHSPHILSVLGKLILYYPGVDLQDKEMRIAYPYEVLFRYWDDFQKIVTAFDQKEESITITNAETGSEIVITCDQVTYDHLKVLLSSGPVEKSTAQFTHLRNSSTTKAVQLVTVCGCSSNRERSFSRKSGSSEAGPHPLDKWRLFLWNLAYNDQKLKRQSHIVDINRYNGEKKISDLSVFPTRFMEDQDEAKKELIKRVDRYANIDNQYRGDIIVDHRNYKPGMQDDYALESLNLSGEEPKDTRGEPLFSKFNDMKCSPDNPLEQAQYLLLPGYVLGFALGKKEWEIAAEPNPMEYLIIDEDNRDLVLAAAGPPREGTAIKPWTTEWSADFVEGKGRGKVVLLHGSPGTGKTMTAECTAKYTKRPLISLSAAELGTAEFLMEERLIKWLDRATMWGAIVLIDEAEVYLEQRQSKDLARNALVTAFLRTMEYFPGLLFLTTNGIGLFDEAIMSRIHLSIRYKKPTDDQRREIWNGLFDKLARDQRNEKQAREEQGAQEREHPKGNPLEKDPKPHNSFIRIEESAQRLALGSVDSRYQKLKLNGREIKNILSTAIRVARHDVYMKMHDKSKPLEEVVVTAKHMEIVLKNKTAFRQDYELARGATPERLAEENMIRAPDPE
ncbi:P-loop containing nucleoside triphosphate hydrolase protein [Acephala macrosclerotiorum]|nr:P-loop containing nucleoside triphosphate hydrolase protein [Acephala macrosclerotiorum]